MIYKFVVVLFLVSLVACTFDAPTIVPATATQPALSPATSTPGIGSGTAIDDVPLVLTGTLIDGTGADPVPDAAIVIQSGRIIAVGSRAQIEIPDNARRMDFLQATLLPGFINTHVHKAFDTELLKIWAQAGVTTVRDLGAPRGSSYFSTRNTWQVHPQVARVVAAGPLVTVPNGYPIAGNAFPSLAVTSPDDARKKISTLIGRGADVIKITLESSVGPILSPEEAIAIVETAHQHGIPVSAHVTRLDDLKRALEAGVDDIAHIVVEPVPDEIIRQMVQADVYWVPTLTAQGGGGDNLYYFVKAGGQVALGNDAGYIEGLEIGMPIREIKRMRSAGMTPMQIIVASTRNAAYVCRLDDTLGTLEVGKQADVLVVEGNPLEDLDALTRVQLVVHAGVIIR